jgi:Zn-finger nucleic acid-binding protein
MPDRDGPALVQTGRPLETRWPCPVCVGVLMEKTHIGPRAELTLDFCPRCGGLWFDKGEVGHLARREQSIVHHLVLEPRDRVRPPCQGCGAPLDREAEKCAAWRLNLAQAADRLRRRGTGSEALAVGGDVLLHSMFWAPDLVVYGGMAAGNAIGAAAEVAGSAAEGVFSTVMEIIAGLFE